MRGSGLILKVSPCRVEPGPADTKGIKRYMEDASSKGSLLASSYSLAGLSAHYLSGTSPKLRSSPLFVPGSLLRYLGEAG